MYKMKIITILLLSLTLNAADKPKPKKLPNPTPEQMAIIYKKLSEMRRIEASTLWLWQWNHGKRINY